MFTLYSKFTNKYYVLTHGQFVLKGKLGFGHGSMEVFDPPFALKGEAKEISLEQYSIYQESDLC